VEIIEQAEAGDSRKLAADNQKKNGPTVSRLLRNSVDRTKIDEKMPS
jgi:hypothetical protein